MKKIAAFLMAFALCVVCFGTYGFADLACTDDSHAHNHEVLAADSNLELPEDDEPALVEYLFINQRNTTVVYSEVTKTLTVTLYIDSESTAKGAVGSLTITAPYYVLGKPVVSYCNVFGTSAHEVTTTADKPSANAYSNVKFNVNMGTNENGFTQTGFMSIVYPVDTDYVNMYSWLRQVNISVSGAVITTNGTTIRFDPNGSVYAAYICNHERTSTRVSVKPTCQKPGEEQTFCAVCNYVISTKALFPTDHDLDYSKAYNQTLYPYVKPTCSTFGEGCFKCNDCGVLIKASIPKLDHTFGERVLQNGVYYLQCSVCGTKEVAKDQCAHSKDNYELLSVIETSTCTKAGSARYRCPVCKQIEERALPLAEHKYAATPTVVTSATCTTNGIRTNTCTVCKDTVAETIPMLGHAMSDWTTTVAATCTTSGTQERICTRIGCNEKETKAIQGGGHSYGSWEVTQRATCITQGVETRTCFNCGNKENRSIMMTGHSYGAWNTTTPSTCTEQGVETRICLICNVPETRALAIDSENHKYGEWKTVTAKTCTTDGEKSRTCERCSKVDVEKDPCTGHVLGDAIPEGKANVKSCGVCGYKEIIENGKNGTTKTLATVSGGLTLSGTEAGKSYVFELGVPDMETEAYYRQYQTFHKAYTFKLLENGKEAPVNTSMTLSIALDPMLEDYEVSVLRLVGNSFYPVNTFEREDNEVIIPGAELTDADVLFIVRGEERSMNLWIPIVLTVAVLAVAGVAIFFFMSKGKRKEF